MADTALQSAAPLICGFESFRAYPYLDVAGVWTIGYGSIRTADGSPITGDTPPISEPAARALMMGELGAVAAQVDTMMVCGTDCQRTALYSFAYNLGSPALRGSTLLRLHNAGDYPGAAAQFLLWDKAHVNGVLTEVPGLLNRRQREASIYINDDVPLPVSVAQAPANVAALIAQSPIVANTAPPAAIPPPLPAYAHLIASPPDAVTAAQDATVAAVLPPVSPAPVFVPPVAAAQEAPPVSQTTITVTQTGIKQDLTKFQAWIGQKSTIHGLGVVALVATALVAHFFGADPQISAMLGMISYGLTHAGITENPSTQSFEVAAENALDAIAKKN